MEEGGVSHWEKGAAMAAWVQQRDGAMPATAAALLRTEEGDEARTMGHLGQASREAKWVGRWCRFELAGRPRPESGWAC
jgi:hypothetical protein